MNSLISNSMNSLIGNAFLEPTPVAKECYVDSLIGQLKRRQSNAKVEFDQATAALEALEKNPEIANVLELITKVGR